MEASGFGGAPFAGGGGGDGGFDAGADYGGEQQYGEQYGYEGEGQPYDGFEGDPAAQDMSDAQRAQEAHALAQQYPELNDPATAERVLGEAHRVAQMLGAPELGGEP